MRLKPVNDKIVVKPTEKGDDQVTVGGIILPDTVQDGALVEGKVVAVTDGMYSAHGKLIPVVVSEGDTILYSKHAAVHEHSIDNDSYVLMSVNEIISIVKDK